MVLATIPTANQDALYADARATAQTLVERYQQPRIALTAASLFAGAIEQFEQSPFGAADQAAWYLALGWELGEICAHAN